MYRRACVDREIIQTAATFVLALLFFGLDT